MRVPCLTAVLIVFILLHGCQQDQQSERTASPRTTESGGSGAALETESATVQATNPDDSAVAAGIVFLDVSDSTGIDFRHVSGDSDQKPFPAANGSGLAALDYDLDGQQDLYFLNGTTFPISEEPGGPQDRFFRNQSSWSFSEVTQEAGLGSLAYSAGVVSADFNLDGFPDLYVTGFGENHFYLNLGDGCFQEVGHPSGVADPSWGTSAAALDFDTDGDLDLYVCNYAEWTWETNVFCGNREENIRIFCSPRSVRPVADRLFENLGDGQFRDVVSQAGLDREPGRGQGVVAADIDSDGLTDLYVGNDINSNFLFRNQGDGTFEDLTDLAGTAVDFAGQTQAGMGVDVADIDRDGFVEIFVTNYEAEHNAFYQNLGNNIFQDASQSKGMAAPSMRWVGWGTQFADFDLDGWTDLVITNGHTDNNLQKMGRDALYEQPPLLFKNQDGRLMPVQSGKDSYFGTRHPGRALCVADLDGDLVPDIVMGHKDEAPAILRNITEPDDEKIVVVLSFVGRQSNRDGIGTDVEVVGSSPLIRDQVTSGGSYLSSHPHSVTLCLPRDQTGQLKIRWPGGRTEDTPLPTLAGRYTVVEGRGSFLLIANRN